MREQLALSEIAGAGVRFEADEAVAVAQQLIASSRVAAAVEPLSDPPSLDNVSIDRDGFVACRGCATPTALEVAMLLDAMLPPGGPTRVPGALRYAIARALLQVVAPPYASIAEFAAALKRFEKADRQVVVRRLFARAGPRADSPDAAPPDLVDATDIVGDWVLKPAPDVDAVTLPGDPTARIRPRRRRAAVVGAVAVTSAFGIGYVVGSQMPWDSAPAPPQLALILDQIAGPVSPPTSGTSGVSGADDYAAVRDATVLRESTIVRALSKSAGSVFSPSFARTGRTLFFHTGRNEQASALMAADLTGADPQITTILDDGLRNYHVQPSPAGDRIAFDSDRDGERGVYVANRDGSDIQRVSGSGYAAVPTWSIDGRQLAFTRAEPDQPNVWNVWLLTLDTGDTRRLTNFRFGQTWGASWFPDGRICYAHEDRLYIRDLATGAVREVESPVKRQLVRTPAVSLDGSRVIFQVARHGAWLLDVRQGTLSQVLDDPTADEFAWAPNGRVAFHSRRDGQWGIWLMNPT